MRGLVLVALAGCGRVGFDPLGDVPAAFDAPFSPPQLITELVTPNNEDDPSMTGDLLELYYASTVTGTDTVWRTTRSAIGDPWSPPQMVSELTITGSANNPKVALDGLSIYFASTRPPNAGSYDLWISTRPDRSSNWSPPTHIDELATVDDDFEPCMLPDNLTMYFSRDTGGNPLPNRVERPTTTSPFGTAVPVTSLDAPGYDGSPFVTSDELGAMLFSRRGGLTRSQIFRATRAVATDTFSAPVIVPDVDVGGSVEDPWLSPDGHVLLLSANPTGQFDLYMATR